MTTIALYVAAALAEIAGCFAFWAWWRLDKSPLWLVPGIASLILFAWLLALSDTSAAGRAYAAYGGIYIVGSILWLWLAEGQRPDRWDIAGAAICLAVVGLSLFAEFLANDRPLLIRYNGHWYVPVLQDYSEDTFGSDFLPTDADYTEPDVQASINAHGWMIWPPIRYSYDSIVKRPSTPAPSPPDWKNLLGTDDQSRDVLARVIYGFRISVLFGFTLTAISSEW